MKIHEEVQIYSTAQYQHISINKSDTHWMFLTDILSQYKILIWVFAVNKQVKLSSVYLTGFDV